MGVVVYVCHITLSFGQLKKKELQYITDNNDGHHQSTSPNISIHHLRVKGPCV